MFHDRSVHKKINKIHERALRIVYKDIYLIYMIFDLFREGYPSTEVFFQGALQKKNKEIVNPVLIF